MRLFLFLIYFICFISTARTQETGTTDSLLLLPKSINAVFFSGNIKIDGQLNEPEWQQAVKADRFIQNAPNPGKPARQPSEVWMMYDNSAIYIGAWLHDVSKDSIIHTLSKRDANDNADAFNVSIDTYNDDQNAFAFTVTSAGVQIDTRITQSGEDLQWNAVWYSAVKFTDKGWLVEMKIPFSALRFAEAKEQTWGINFSRTIRRYRETSHWSYINPLVAGSVNQYGDLSGIKDIKSPVRLSFTPYVSGYYNRYDDHKNGIHETNTSFNGGMDLKYGINDAFTLDMTLIPDFGQVQSDNIVLNTTPYEVKYNEFRQFFTEGTDIYNKSGLFYSRRIGSRPINYYGAYDAARSGETVIKNPQSARLINATKVTGRTHKGTGIGIFNAVTGNTYATLEDSSGNQRQVITDPVTNYNVLVIDQNLRNNSYINLTNTSVVRAGNFYDANVTGLNTKLNTKGNKYGMGLSGVLTQQPGLYEAGKNQLGHSAGISLGKQSGTNTFGLSYSEESDTYDPNDLGYLQNNNSRTAGINYGHYIYQPRKTLLSSWVEGWITYERLYNPDVYTYSDIGFNIGGTTRKWLTLVAWGTFAPVESYDYFEPRVKGRYYARPAFLNLGTLISSDYRKKFALDVRTVGTVYQKADWNQYTLTVSPRYRFSDHLFAVLSFSYDSQNAEQGSALTLDGLPTLMGDTIVFAMRNRHTYENILSTQYSFTNKMALTLRIRHYWSKLIYTSFHTLGNDGTLIPSSYLGLDPSGKSLHDNSFNAFNIDMVYTWVFAPGSELRFVWKNSIYDFSQQTQINYYNDLYTTIRSPQTNSFSVKLIYYLDVLMFRKNKG